MVILECIKIICTITQTTQANPDPSVKDIRDNMKVKWCAYFNEFPPIYAIAAILYPGVKLQDYGAVIQPQPVGSSMDTSRFGFVGPVLKKQRPDRSGPSSSSSNVEDFHIIQWWKNHPSKFLVIARITKDIVAIPASTIASESASSVCRRVLDDQRSCLSSESNE
ncbi:putative AC9 transposase, partial [Bienertia sinuspersici]